MNKQSGVTLVTVIIMIIIITIIASISIVGGRAIVTNARNQVKNNNLADVQAVVSRESAKINTAGVLTPAYATFYGEENVVLDGKNIGKDWYYLDEATLGEMGVEYVNEHYVANYKLNVVIPLSGTEDLHDQIEYYNTTLK